MPAMTLQTLMSEATAMAGNRMELNASTVSLQVNLAQLEVAAMLPHTELMANTNVILTAGSGATTLPADFGEAVDLFRQNSFDSFGHRLLTPVPVRYVDDAPNSTGTATGVALAYAISANSLLVYPPTTSADTLTLRYVKVPADMTALTNLPSLHTRYHPAILLKTVEYLCDRALDSERAAYYRNRFISVMGSVPTADQVRFRSERTM